MNQSAFARCFTPSRYLNVLMLLGLCLFLTPHLAARTALDEQRAALAQNHPVLAAPAAGPDQAEALARAIDAPMQWLRDTELSARNGQVIATGAFGDMLPLAGDKLAVLSTGVAGDPARPGQHFSALGDDETRLVLHFDAPPNGRQLSFRYRFLTAEYPEFATVGAHDHFEVFVTDADGRREVTRVSAADPDLTPVSATNAGGTGFDLFANDQTRLAGPFNFGQPAAALTGWRTVTADIAQSGPVSVEFIVRDQGDGLLDSAVALDALRLNAIALERAPVAAPQNLDEALNCLFQGGIVVGAVADGETRIIFRFFNLPVPGTVTFSLPGAMVPADGGFGPIGGDQRLEQITVPTQLGAQGHEGLAQYLVPEEFNRGGNENQASRNVTFQAHYIPEDPEEEPQTVQAPFQLWRPPVILMHGLWSSAADSWAGSPLDSDARLRTFVGDYKDTNAAWFAINTLQPATPIRDACNAMWNGQVALSQVDYVGHSMGGIVGRNFNAAVPNLFNKFFTVNTPHLGSPLGNLVVSIREWANNRPAWIRNKIFSLFEDNLGAIDQGALDDLSTDSSGINAIPATTIPSHALVGVGGSDLVGDALALAPGNIGLLFKIINFLDDNTDIFAGIQHDLIVGRISQQGGIAPSAQTLFNGLHSIHTNAPGSEQYRDRIIELLNSDQTGATFSGFPAPSSQRLGTAAEPAGDPGTEFADGQIEITAPAPGTLVEPGSTIAASVAAVGAFDLQSALIFSPQEGVEVDSAPFSVNIPVAQNYLGPLSISALGRDGAGVVSFTESVEILVATDIPLTGIEVVQRNPVLFDHTDQRQLTVLGSFNDGIVRDVTHPSTGTTYASFNEDVVRVTEGGKLIPIAEGETTVLVQNDGFQDSITVRVNEILFLFIDRFEQ